MEIQADPGSLIKESVTVYGDAGDLIKLSAEYFSPSGNLGEIQNFNINPYYKLPEYCINQGQNEIKDGKNTETPCDLLLYLNSPLKWLKFSRDQFILDKTSDTSTITSKQVEFKLAIPGKAPAGDYYVTLFATNLGKARGSVQGQTQHQSKIGTNLVLTIKSDKNELQPKPEITEFKAPIITTHMPFAFTAKVENKGNTYFKTYRNVEVYNASGTKVADSNLVPINILKNSARFLQTNLQPGKVVADPTENKSVLGATTTRVSPNYYTAYLNIYPNNEGDAPLVSKVSFIYIPGEFIIGILIIFGGYIYYRIYKKRLKPKKINNYVKPRKF